MLGWSKTGAAFFFTEGQATEDTNAEITFAEIRKSRIKEMLANKTELDWNNTINPDNNLNKNTTNTGHKPRQTHIQPNLHHTICHNLSHNHFHVHLVKTYYFK